MIDATKKKDDRGNVKLPPDLHKVLSHYAIDQGISLADVVRRGWEALNARIPHGKSLQTVPMLYSLLPENVGKLSPGDLEWLRRLVGVAVERLNATDKEDERRNDSPADPDSIAEAARAEEDRAYKIAEKLRGVEPIDKPAPGRTGKRGGRPPKPPGGGGGD